MKAMKLKEATNNYTQKKPDIPPTKESLHVV